MKTLWDQPKPALDKHADAADAWVETHPEEWAAIKRYALKRLRDHGKVSMKAVFEDFRYDRDSSRSDSEEFKINNNWTRPLGQRLEREDPMFVGKITKRKRTSAGEVAA